MGSDLYNNLFTQTFLGYFNNVSAFALTRIISGFKAFESQALLNVDLNIENKLRRQKLYFNLLAKKTIKFFFITHEFHSNLDNQIKEQISLVLTIERLRHNEEKNICFPGYSKAHKKSHNLFSFPFSQ